MLESINRSVNIWILRIIEDVELAVCKLWFEHIRELRGSLWSLPIDGANVSDISCGSSAAPLLFRRGYLHRKQSSSEGRPAYSRTRSKAQVRVEMGFLGVERYSGG